MLTLAGCSPPTGLNKIEHVIVVSLENHSFDNLYGQFPGAAGLAEAMAQKGTSGDTLTQLDGATGTAYATLPAPFDASKKMPDTRFPADLPNAPFDISGYVPSDTATPDLVHRYYQEQQQIHGGKMDFFAWIADAKGLTMGYYPTAQLPLAKYASDYTLCDHFFHSAFGGSFLNHIFLISAAVPTFSSAPDSMVITFNADGSVLNDGAVTKDGYVVNTAFSVNSPHPAGLKPETLVPNLTFRTIGDALTDAGVSWIWYSGGWNDAIAGKPASTFQFHHQAFAYFQNYADKTRGRAQHLKDETDFIAALSSGELPAVSFVKPLGDVNEHPGYANLAAGEQHAAALIDAVRKSRYWSTTAIIVTYDENGGFWDHVAPPKIDPWGPGARVPTLIISPYAKKGFVDSTSYETLSILSLIEHRYGLGPLGTRDGAANDLTGAFDFGG
jgi:phospholipase C